jgi:hypothetical protein
VYIPLSTFPILPQLSVQLKVQPERAASLPVSPLTQYDYEFDGAFIFVLSFNLVYLLILKDDKIRTISSNKF